MITGRRNSLALAGILFLVAVSIRWASAHGIEDDAQLNYTFGPTVKSLALSAKLERQVANVGAPIAIKFAITNFGSPIRIFRIGWATEYTVTGTGPGGIPIRKDNRGVGAIASVDTGMDLASGSTYVNPVEDLGMLYDFRTPGTYTFVCQTELTLAYEAPVYAVLTSTLQTLDVVEPPATESSFGPPDNKLELGVKLDEQIVNAGTPIKATFALKNFGPPILVYWIPSLMEYGLIGTGPGNVPIAKTHEVPFSGSVPSGTNIGTGEALENTANLSQFYGFQKPGRYTFFFITTVNLQHHAEAYAHLRSNILTVDVR